MARTDSHGTIPSALRVTRVNRGAFYEGLQLYLVLTRSCTHSFSLPLSPYFRSFWKCADQEARVAEQRIRASNVIQERRLNGRSVLLLRVHWIRRCSRKRSVPPTSLKYLSRGFFRGEAASKGDPSCPESDPRVLSSSALASPVRFVSLF